MRRPQDNSPPKKPKSTGLRFGGALRGETRGRLPAVRGEDTDGVDAAARVRSKRLAAEMEKEDSEWFDSPTLL